MADLAPVVIVELYRCAPGRKGSRGQRWRWRAVNAGNHRKLANAGEAYTNRQDALDAITELFGSGSNVVLRESGQDDSPLRSAQQ